ncbi:Putative NTF2-like domain superfamily protein [Septoria linicola]|uniref:NTF2-like domain superfamily protein n=1 Tax=Septoria linicola TaxID=215465 RepID=A0A9Q9ANA9_9PEZI|nr:Putative NTF2-like domain superfamily protein [Septoria linicola]
MTQIKTSSAEFCDIQAIKSLIQKFFDAINDADTKALASHFFPNANLTIIRQDPPRAPSNGDENADGEWRGYYEQFTGIKLPSTSSSASSTEAENAKKEDREKDKLTIVLRTTIERFIALLDAGKKRREGQPDLKIHEEPDLDATDVKVDELFGSAWSPFRVTFDGALHHYGILVYTLGREEEGGEWRIEGLTQKYRRTPGWEGEREFL